MNRGFLRVDYNDVSQESYTGLRLSIRTKEEPEQEFIFNTGDPVVDWWDYLMKTSDFELDILSQSSSVDHFFMDGTLYYEANLDYIKKCFVSNEDAYEGFELKRGIIGVCNRSDWTYEQWHRHLYEQGRHKKH